MSTESENLYTKNNQLIAQIYDNLSGENKSEEAISLLLNPNHISPTEQVKILGLLGEKDERFHSLLIKTVLNNINILDNNESFKIINNHFKQLVNQAYLLDDNAIIKICQDLFYLISQGVAAFYPYIWILLKNHGHITTHTDKKLESSAIMQSFSVSMGTMLNPSEKYSKATVYYAQNKHSVHLKQ